MVETGDSTNLEPIRLKGIGVSPGVVVARAYLLQPDQWHVSKRALQPDEIEHEICRFENIRYTQVKLFIFLKEINIVLNLIIEWTFP